MTEPFTPEQLVEFHAIHDFDDPMSHLARLEAIYLAVLGKSRGDLNCIHCDVQLTPMPMHGTAWGVAHQHEPGCPEDD